jgi:hypothetical protein
MKITEWEPAKKYQDYLEYLVDYAHEDWLEFSVISPKVARVAADDASFEELILVFRKMISDLLDAGAKIGDFAVSEGAPFVGWPGTKEENLASQEKMNEIEQKLTDSLGQPEVKAVPKKGRIEVWNIDKNGDRTVTFREFSKTGGDTLHLTKVPGIDLKRLHIEGN